MMPNTATITISPPMVMPQSAILSVIRTLALVALRRRTVPMAVLPVPLEASLASLAMITLSPISERRPPERRHAEF